MIRMNTAPGGASPDTMLGVIGYGDTGGPQGVAREVGVLGEQPGGLGHCYLLLDREVIKNEQVLQAHLCV